jgi:hypothetical protein
VKKITQTVFSGTDGQESQDFRGVRQGDPGVGRIHEYTGAEKGVKTVARKKEHQAPKK